MAQISRHLVDAERLVCEEQLRRLVLNLNALAALETAERRPRSAASLYTRALRAAEQLRNPTRSHAEVSASINGTPAGEPSRPAGCVDGVEWEDARVPSVAAEPAPLPGSQGAPLDLAGAALLNEGALLDQGTLLDRDSNLLSSNLLSSSLPGAGEGAAQADGSLLNSGGYLLNNGSGLGGAAKSFPLGRVLSEGSVGLERACELNLELSTVRRVVGVRFTLR
ncbi:hypothetical protein T492DRAFT_218047 [Pavlovales sp. CCMP2436]|nr:hypothetical protein T492DRAFT_218047 [Pavlovales sp. CCMP2436]